MTFGQRCVTGVRVELYLGILLMGLASVIWWWPRRALRETTLGGPWLWMWLGVMAVLLCEMLVAVGGEASRTWSQPLRFAATSGLFCGTISLLGAKRPQDGAWHFIVLTLWGVLALPALEVAFLGRGEDLQLQDVRAWFLWILIGLEFSQRLGTYHWPASALMAASQGILLARYLPLIRWELPESVRWGGVSLAVLSMLILLRPLPRRPASYDRLWLDFRDQFGVAWSLRAMERINAAADRYQWPFRLHWQGFAATPPGSAEASAPQNRSNGKPAPPPVTASDPKGVFGSESSTNFEVAAPPPPEDPPKKPKGVFGSESDTNFEVAAPPPPEDPPKKPKGVFGSESDTSFEVAAPPPPEDPPKKPKGVFGSESDTNCEVAHLPLSESSPNYRSVLGRDSGVSPQIELVLEQTMYNLLRRFVSDRWISERLGKARDSLEMGERMTSEPDGKDVRNERI